VVNTRRRWSGTVRVRPRDRGGLYMESHSSRSASIAVRRRDRSAFAGVVDVLPVCSPATLEALRRPRPRALDTVTWLPLGRACLSGPRSEKPALVNEWSRLLS
jgi:hypothetical protein